MFDWLLSISHNVSNPRIKLQWIKFKFNTSFTKDLDPLKETKWNYLTIL